MLLPSFKEDTVVRTLISVLSNEDGQGFAEYGVILGLIAVLCLASMMFLSGRIRGFLSAVGSSV